MFLGPFISYQVGGLLGFEGGPYQKIWLQRGGPGKKILSVRGGGGGVPKKIISIYPVRASVIIGSLTSPEYP